MTDLARVQAGLAWGIIALGFIHALATPWFVPESTERALWFASGGGAFVLVGVLNLIAVARNDTTLITLSRTANVVTAIFVVALVFAPPTGTPELAAALLIIPATVVSLLRSGGAPRPS